MLLRVDKDVNAELEQTLLLLWADQCFNYDPLFAALLAKSIQLHQIQKLSKNPQVVHLFPNILPQRLVIEVTNLSVKKRPSKKTFTLYS